MLVLGILPPRDALASINLDVLLLLLGMMLLVSGLEACGFFDVVSVQIAARARTPRSFLAALMIVTAALSALVLNDAIALLMTPIVLRATRSLRTNPTPYLVGLAVSANIGSVATEVGNPQNAYVAIASGIPFVTFTFVLLPVALVSLALAIVLMGVAFRSQLAVPLDRTALPGPVPFRRGGLALSLAVTAAVVAAFFVASPDWLPLVALAGGSFVLFFLPLVSPTSARALLGKVDWSILLFFVGLFVLLAGVESSGLSESIRSAFSGLAGGGLGGVPSLVGLTAVLSNLFSNVPAVLLLAHAVPPATPQMWLALASSSTLAGNATILGAACNVIVVQLAAREGVEISMRDFVKAGLPITLATLGVAVVLLSVLG